MARYGIEWETKMHDENGSPIPCGCIETYGTFRTKRAANDHASAWFPGMVWNGDTGTHTHVDHVYRETKITTAKIVSR